MISMKTKLKELAGISEVSNEEGEDVAFCRMGVRNAVISFLLFVLLEFNEHVFLQLLFSKHHQWFT